MNVHHDDTSIRQMFTRCGCYHSHVLCSWKQRVFRFNAQLLFMHGRMRDFLTLSQRRGRYSIVSMCMCVCVKERESLCVYEGSYAL